MTYIVWNDPAFEHLSYGLKIGESETLYKVKIMDYWVKLVPKKTSTEVTALSIEIDLDRYGYPAEWRLNN